MTGIPELRALAALVEITSAPIAQAIGWALVQFVWQGALIGALTALTLVVLRRSAPDIRYVVSTIALTLMLTIPAVTAVNEINSARRIAPAVASDLPPASSTRVDVRGSAGTILAPEVPGTFPRKVPATFAEERLQPDRAATSPTASRLTPWLLLGWMLGVCLLTLRLLSGWLWVRRLKTHGASPARPLLLESARRLARQLHVRRPFRLVESVLVEVPIVIGWLKPVVLLPASALAGLTPMQLEAILAHELAHIRRHDYFVNLLQTLVETLLFYHPAVWYVSRQIRIERENCCDDLAVSLCGDPVVYAEALADLEQLRGSARPLVMAANGGSLLYRIRRVLCAPSHAGRGPGWLAGSVSIAIMLVMAGIAASAITREVRQPAAANRAGERDDRGASTIGRPAEHLRQTADRLRQGTNALRHGANEVRSGIDEIRRDANDLRRRTPRAVATLRETMRTFANDLRRAAHNFAMAVHSAFPQIPPPPPVPPVPPEPPSLLEPPVPPEPASVVERFSLPVPVVPPAPPFPPVPSFPPAPTVGFPQPVPPVPPAPVAPPAALVPPVPLAPPAPAVLPVPPAPRERWQERKSSTSQRRGNFTWSNNGEKLEVEYRGEVEFTDDDTDVKTLTPGGLLRITDEGRLGGHTVEFRADSSGTIERRFWVGSSERPFEPEGRRWLAGALPRFIRQTGIGAPARVARIFKAKGAQGVLAEIALVEGSWAKRIYFAELLNTAGLDPGTVQQVLAQAGREVDSDFELASLLMSADRLLTFDEATRKVYFDAARSIDSDFELRRVLSSALKKGPLTPAVLTSVLDTSMTIESDFEQASLLIEVGKLQPLDDASRAPFFKALDTVNSDFERRRVLSSLMKRGDLPPPLASAVLTSATDIHSDFEIATVLLEVVRSRPIEGALRDPFFRAVASIGSGFERGRVLQEVAKQRDVSDETILEVIKATRVMSGSFESAQVLLAVAASHPLTREARDAYIDAAEKLGDFEQGRVLSALVKNERRR